MLLLRHLRSIPYDFPNDDWGRGEGHWHRSECYDAKQRTLAMPSVCPCNRLENLNKQSKYYTIPDFLMIPQPGLSRKPRLGLPLSHGVMGAFDSHYFYDEVKI